MTRSYEDLTYDELLIDPRMQAAIKEIQNLILAKFPGTTFTVGEWDEPGSVYMRAIVDVDDTDEVTELFIDRLVDFQVDENLPIYVVTVRTPERRAAAAERERRDRYRIAQPG
jgi:hypothetical protein